VYPDLAGGLSGQVYPRMVGVVHVQLNSSPPPPPSPTIRQGGRRGLRVRRDSADGERGIIYFKGENVVMIVMTT
jgi:hypothetical protein